MLRINKIFSQDTAGLFHYNDPLLATSQHARETKPWYVCPRTPWRNGWVFDPAPFFGTAQRRLGENPGGLMQAAFIWGLGWGLSTCTKDATFLGPDTLRNSALQRNVRLGHHWAMKRLAFVWMLRPALLGTIAAGSYAVPKELFSQNFGRRNKRGFYDPVPHYVGMVFAYPAMSMIMGRTYARTFGGAMLFGGMLYDGFHYMGHNIHNQQRELTYPIILSHLYGLPNGGEGFDNFVDGEHAKQWRLESTTESMFINGKHSLASSSRYDNHPLHKQEWGQSAYFS